MHEEMEQMEDIEVVSMTVTKKCTTDEKLTNNDLPRFWLHNVLMLFLTYQWDQWQRRNTWHRDAKIWAYHGFKSGLQWSICKYTSSDITLLCYQWLALSLLFDWRRWQRTTEKGNSESGDLGPQISTDQPNFQISHKPWLWDPRIHCCKRLFITLCSFET